MLFTTCLLLKIQCHLYVAKGLILNGSRDRTTLFDSMNSVVYFPRSIQNVCTLNVSIILFF